MEVSSVTPEPLETSNHMTQVLSLLLPLMLKLQNFLSIRVGITAKQRIQTGAADDLGSVEANIFRNIHKAISKMVELESTHEADLKALSAQYLDKIAT